MYKTAFILLDLLAVIAIIAARESEAAARSSLIVVKPFLRLFLFTSLLSVTALAARQMRLRFGSWGRGDKAITWLAAIALCGFGTFQACAQINTPKSEFRANKGGSLTNSVDQVAPSHST
jgi:hypothetical protein